MNKMKEKWSKVIGSPSKKERIKREPLVHMSSACENHQRSAAEGPSLGINKW